MGLNSNNADTVLAFEWHGAAEGWLCHNCDTCARKPICDMYEPMRLASLPETGHRIPRDLYERVKGDEHGRCREWRELPRGVEMTHDAVNAQSAVTDQIRAAVAEVLPVIEAAAAQIVCPQPNRFGNAVAVLRRFVESFESNAKGGESTHAKHPSASLQQPGDASALAGMDRAGRPRMDRVCGCERPQHDLRQERLGDGRGDRVGCCGARDEGADARQEANP